MNTHLIEPSTEPNIPTHLVAGPFRFSTLAAMFESAQWRAVLNLNSSEEQPNSMKLVWDESQKEGWVNISGFHTQTMADEWLAWLPTALQRT